MNPNGATRYTLSGGQDRNHLGNGELVWWHDEDHPYRVFIAHRYLIQGQTNYGHFYCCEFSRWPRDYQDLTDLMARKDVVIFTETFDQRVDWAFLTENPFAYFAERIL